MLVSLRSKPLTPQVSDYSVYLQKASVELASDFHNNFEFSRVRKRGEKGGCCPKKLIYTCTFCTLSAFSLAFLIIYQ